MELLIKEAKKESGRVTENKVWQNAIRESKNHERRAERQARKWYGISE